MVFLFSIRVFEFKTVYSELHLTLQKKIQPFTQRSNSVNFQSMIYKILSLPDPRLFKRADPISVITPEIQLLTRNMLETLYAEDGCGLAAPQLGISLRLVVIDVDQPPDRAEPGEPRVLINPQIQWRSETLIPSEEGCLSVPGIYEKILRSDQVVVDFLDADGKEQTLEAKGLLAACIQHETDHLDGILMIDHLSKLKRHRALSRLRR